MHYGEQVYYGDGSVHGKSERNAVVMHQRDSSKYPSSGVSTTPNFEHAVRYATYEEQAGYVYKIDVDQLEDHGVRAFPVDQHASSPAIPDDYEVLPKDWK